VSFDGKTQKTKKLFLQNRSKKSRKSAKTGRFYYKKNCKKLLFFAPI
jgi:hypothetical protein